MLILTRKKSETVHIGDGISVTVIRVSGNKVRLGVSAPREMRVMRVELDARDDDEATAKKEDAPTKRTAGSGGLRDFVDKAKRGKAA